MSLIRGFDQFLHGGDYNPDQWLRFPEVIDDDFRLMKLAGCNTFSVGIFAWSQLEPEEGRYEFAWLDDIMDRMEKVGHNVLLATPSGAKPFWLSEKYEEVRRVTREGQRELSGGRHNHCWSSPVYRAKVREMNQQLATRYGKHPALKMWHVSNEYGGECYCPLCLQGFRGWLQQRYGSLDAINAAYWSSFWGHRFTDWNQIDPRLSALDGVMLDWPRFVAWQIQDFYRWEAEPLRRLSPRIPVLTNVMGFHLGIDYHLLASHLDLVADDSYPSYDGDSPHLLAHAAEFSMKFDMLRCLKGKPQPWFLMESCIDGRQVWYAGRLKHPGLHHLEMFQAIAHGADGTMYFQWRKGRGGCEKDHGAVVAHMHPEETRSFRDVQALSQRYEKITEVLGSINRADTALLLDWDSRWAYRAAMGTPDSRNPEALIAHASQHYLPFWRRGATVDVLASTHDFRSYKMVIVPRLYSLQTGVAQRMKEFVRQGGTVVMTALTGMVNETNLCWTDGCPGDGLEEMAGIWLEEIDVFRDKQETRPISAVEGNTLGLTGSWKAGFVCGRIHNRGATTLACYADGWMKGQPAITAHAFGKGTVYYLAADFDAEGLDQFYQAVLRSLDVATFLEDKQSLPGKIGIAKREKDGSSYWFLLNFSKAETKISVPNQKLFDLESGKEVTANLPLSPWQAIILREQK